MLHMFLILTIQHRSDSSQGSDYIAIFVSLISSSGGQNFKIWRYHLVGNSCFHLKQDIHVDADTVGSINIQILQ